MNGKQRVIFVHRFDLANSGSFKMRGLDFAIELNEKKFDAECASETAPSLRKKRGCVIIFIKPIKLGLPKALSKYNTVIIDPLDDAHILPKIQLPFQFIFSSNRSKEHYQKKFQLNKAHLLFHHFDQRITRPSHLNALKSIAYVGDPIKLENLPKQILNIQYIDFNEFLAHCSTAAFHWTIKPPQFDFEPLTKTVTALAGGAIPIINSLELGEILPKDYPFHISSGAPQSALLKLRNDLEDEKKIGMAKSLISRIDITHYSIQSSVIQLMKIIEESQKESPAIHFRLFSSAGILFHDLKIDFKRLYHRLRSF